MAKVATPFLSSPTCLCAVIRTFPSFCNHFFSIEWANSGLIPFITFGSFWLCPLPIVANWLVLQAICCVEPTMLPVVHSNPAVLQGSLVRSPQHLPNSQLQQGRNGNNARSLSDLSNSRFHPKTRSHPVKKARACTCVAARHTVRLYLHTKFDTWDPSGPR